MKVIEVKSGEKLSLQMHHHRSEYWIIVRGTAEVEVDDKTKILTELGFKAMIGGTLVSLLSATFVGMLLG